nr:unnamed protein product [Callosobruchus chinensis]
MVLGNSFDVMCVTETWLNPDLPSDSVSIPGFTFLRKDRLGRGGGVGIYLRKCLSFERILLDFDDANDIEHIWVSLRVNRSITIIIGVVYRPPSVSYQNVLDYTDNILSFITPQWDNIVVLGDFNVDQTYDNELNRSYISYDFQQQIDEPTRITPSHTIIDLIFTNVYDQVHSSRTMDSNGISDHLVVFCEFRFHIPRPRPFSIRYRDYKQFCYCDFYVDLVNLQWDDILYLNNIDDKLTLLNELIVQLFDKHAPVKSARITKPYAPWITNNVKKMMRERDIALQKYKQTKSISDHSNYAKLRNLVLSAIRREKAAYLSSKLNTGNSCVLWQTINRLNIKKKQFSEIPLYLKNAGEINEHFMSVFSPENSCPIATDYYNSHRFAENIEFSLRLATVDEIKHIALNLKSNAFGVDDINADMILYCLPVIAKYITHIINCCIEAGYFPQLWKFSLIKPLPKSKSVLTYDDLRPISLLPTLSKVFERFIYFQLFEYVTSKGILPEMQSGFRKGYSTTSVLLKVSDYIIRSLDAGLATLLVLLDFSKAFDTLDHSLLLAKLRYFGLDEMCLKLFESYLHNRHQCVFVDNNYSDFQSVTSGVPQGSVLGPLFFIIYTSDMFKVIEHCNIQGYADDTQLYISFDPKSINIANDCINQDLESIYIYASRHNLKLNARKCQVMLFSSRAASDLSSYVNINIAGEPLLIVKSTKNLGIIFDCKLRFQEYVSLLVKKTYLVLRLLYRNGGVLNFKLRKKLVESLVFSVLSYGITLYYPCLDSVTKYRLQKIQNC